MRKKVTDEQIIELHAKGLNDRIIGDLLRRSSSAICHRRIKLHLIANFKPILIDETDFKSSLQKANETWKKYKKTDKYIKRVKKYNNSITAKDGRKKYYKSEKYKKYLKSDWYKENKQKYEKSAKYKLIKRKCDKKYHQTEKYKEYQKKFKNSDKAKRYFKEYNKKYQKTNKRKEYLKKYYQSLK